MRANDFINHDLKRILRIIGMAADQSNKDIEKLFILYNKKN